MDLDDIIAFVVPDCTMGEYPKRRIAGVGPLSEAGPEDISYCKLQGEEGEKAISDSLAGVIICNKDLARRLGSIPGKYLIGVSNPRLSFSRCLQRFLHTEPRSGIHTTALVESNAKISPSAYIGPRVYIGESVEIGDGAIIENNVCVSGRCKIGRKVYIQYGAVIGCEGQGFERNEKGELEKFPQFGYVSLEDEVEIGSNSTIVKGTFSATRIGQGSKIGHLTDIGHNVQIGKHVFISAGVVVSGSAFIGDGSWLAPQCCVRNGVRVGARVTVGLGSVVTEDVPEGVTVVGVPAKPLARKKMR
jgi:UDP-3-O-[3-hydroxymyristoyl] glucosamine N-acyltransferase